MLTYLQIKDFLLIDKLELDFKSGLTVITGETGSGKSIIIDALSFVFGAKTNAEIIRKNQQQAVFTASFEISNQVLLNWLELRDLQDTNSNDILICRRIISSNGKSKVFINGNPVNINTIKELGDLVIDIHTQHSSMAILKAENQRKLIDEYASVSLDVININRKYKQLIELEQKISLAKNQIQDLIIKQEILIEKIADLNKLVLIDNEWEELNQKHRQLANANLILQELDFVINLINLDDNSIISGVNVLTNKLSKIHEFIPENIIKSADSLEVELNDLYHSLQALANKIEHNPELLQEIEERIDEIYTISRKYRIQPEEINLKLANWQHELTQLNHKINIEVLEQELAVVKQQYIDLAKQISQKRTQGAKYLSQEVTKFLHQLAINGEFLIIVKPLESWGINGIDDIEYQICFNKGMSLQPLNKVASGGELSRVALALYVVLSTHNPPEIIIFDEIDVGIGGRVAEIVGNLLYKLGTSKQVICITHQPQAASFGDNHLIVSKQLVNDLTTTQIQYVNKEERVNELARMLGGINISDTVISHAREMLS